MERQAFIWDLDGTLLDSYEIIASSLMQMLLEIGIAAPQQSILRYIVNNSVNEFIGGIANETNIAFEQLKRRYSEIH